MSVIAPNFKLSEFIKSLIDDVVWFLLIFSLIGLPLIMMVLFYIPMPVIDGELLTPFLAFTFLADPTRTLPIINAFMTTDMFKIMAFPGFGFAALIAAGTIFIERKMLAKLQLRVGPFYCGKVEGILQLMGDGLKLISKEIIIPAKADKPIFWAAPVLFVASAAAFVALIPVAPGWVVADVDMGLLGVFAVIGFFPIVTILSAWSANSKFPFIGGIRALFQMVSFEIPLILSLLGIVMLTGTLDLVEIVEQAGKNIDTILVPKAGTASDVYMVDCLLTQIETNKKIENKIGIECLIETALGMSNIKEIAKSSERLEALHFGVADYAASLRARTVVIGGLNPDYPGDQWHHGLSELVMTCRAYGLRAIDGPFGDFNDPDAYIASAKRAAAIGIEGKWAIHPSQIDLANKVFSPPEAEVKKAKRILEELDKAAKEGKGAAQLDGRMIDAASARMAENIVNINKKIEDK